MPILSDEQIGRLLVPYLSSASPGLLARLGLYLDLLVKWNSRTNLTAVRDPEEMVVRHFGESLFAARHIGSAQTVLDYGSGAGFPGVPVALLHPGIRITLAESQHKKASFLREVTRALGLDVEVWAFRVEDLPPVRRFDCVTLRAVDDPAAALLGSASRAANQILLMTTDGSAAHLAPPGFSAPSLIPLPGSKARVIALFSRT